MFRVMYTVSIYHSTKFNVQIGVNIKITAVRVCGLSSQTFLSCLRLVLFHCLTVDLFVFSSFSRYWWFISFFLFLSVHVYLFLSVTIFILCFSFFIPFLLILFILSTLQTNAKCWSKKIKLMCFSLTCALSGETLQFPRTPSNIWPFWDKGFALLPHAAYDQRNKPNWITDIGPCSLTPVVIRVDCTRDYHTNSVLFIQRDMIGG
jgi:hypothetical protein